MCQAVGTALEPWYGVDQRWTRDNRSVNSTTWHSCQDKMWIASGCGWLRLSVAKIRGPVYPHFPRAPVARLRAGERPFLVFLELRSSDLGCQVHTTSPSNAIFDTQAVVFFLPHTLGRTDEKHEIAEMKKTQWHS